MLRSRRSYPFPHIPLPPGTGRVGKGLTRGPAVRCSLVEGDHPDLYQCCATLLLVISTAVSA